jgi:hypothetical protein
VSTIHATRDGVHVVLVVATGDKRLRIRLTPEGAERIAAELAMAANIDLTSDLKRDAAGRYRDA